jgi:rhodanese-related sulfurtransferase
MKHIAQLLQCVGVFLILLSSANSAPVVDETPKSSEVSSISVDELKAKFRANEPVLVLDVRSSESYANSTTRIKGAIHVNVRKLKYRLGFSPLKDIPKDREVITYCSCPSEEASILAGQLLKESGLKHVRALKGGWTEWQKANGPIEPRQ